tara:strand:+ start:918 stop:1349 length:432 start_codon:yes stop_codon:yes gene_type:complete
MALNPEVWGPHYWFVIHTIALTYPLNPNDITKKKYYNFIQDLPLFIPDTKSAKQFGELLDKYPLTPYLDSRTSFNKWVNFIHNKINFILEKPDVNLLDAMNRYNDNYKPINQETIDYQKIKEKGLYIALISSLLIIFFILYKK